MKTAEIHPKILYYGTPVALVCTTNDDGTFNLAPISSSWALGYSIVLGFAATGQTAENILQRHELTINLPDAALVGAVERLAPLTGRSPVPSEKAAQFRTERRKFEAAGLTAQASIDVRPPRVRECPLQMEATLANATRLSDESVDAWVLEARVLRVHAHERIIKNGRHIDVAHWHPLLYNYRHYFGRGQHLGATFRAEA